MLPKTAMDRLSEMKAFQAQLDQELKKAQKEADHKEKEHADEAACPQ